MSKYGQKAEERQANQETREGTWVFLQSGNTNVVILETQNEEVEADVYAEATSVVGAGKRRTMGAMRVAVVESDNPDKLPEGWESSVKVLIIVPSLINPMLNLMDSGYLPSILDEDGNIVPLDEEAGTTVFTFNKTGSGMDTEYSVTPMPAAKGRKLLKDIGPFEDIESLIAEANAYTANQLGEDTNESNEAENSPF